MLRPATPLAVVFLAAFVLLLLSTLSTPIIKAIPLASWKGTTFGVWGYCQGNKCSDVGIGYGYAGLTEGSNPSDFTLPTSTRHSLSSILIVHPIAAFLCLICLILSIAAHFHSPSHSPRFLLALLIFTIPTVLVTLLAFLVDILVFVPHVSWGGWIVLGSTILILANMVLTCAMRRTLVSRKARKKRIAENAEMSGQNYYEQRAQVDMSMDRSVPPTTFGTMSNLPRADSPPPMTNDVSPISDKGPEYAAFELQKKSSDDRTPLNSPNGMADSPPRDMDGPVNGGWREPGMGDPYREQERRDQYGNLIPSRNDQYGRSPDRRDQYGNPMSPRNGPYGPQSGAMMGPSSRGRGGPPPSMPRGRGGYYQGPPGRGGFPQRGGYGRGGNYRGGPGGYGGPGRGGPMMGRGGMPRGPPPPGYDQQYFPGGSSQSSSHGGTYAGATMIGSEAARGMSPQGRMMDRSQAPIGQAIEMDDRNGLPSPTNSKPMQYGLRDSDTDVQGMIGMQQQRTSDNPDRGMNASSVYSGAEEQPYVPARAGWQPSASESTVPTSSSLRTPTSHAGSSYPPTLSNRALSPIAHSPVESQQPFRNANSYYEDHDPAFASQSTANAPPLPQQQHTASNMVPTSLMPGPSRPQYTDTDYLPAPQHAAIIDRESSPSSYADRDREGRSPAASESSHLTSVSQRPVNPNWQPGPSQGPRGPPPRQRGEDMLLAHNPEFSVPGAGPSGRARGGGAGGRNGPPRGYGSQQQGWYGDAF